MAADSVRQADCSHCHSAGSVRNGRCDICDWEAERPQPVQLPPFADDDRGTLSRSSG